MARKTKARNKSNSRSEAVEPQQQTRRVTLRQLAAYAVGGGVLVTGGGLFAMDFRKKITELDLDVIGQGTPVIVQIHDPQCAMCTSLQRQARIALRSFDVEAVLYRVANIHTEVGGAFQSREGLPHVTLALFDGTGKRVHVIQGVTPSEELIRAFQTHLQLSLV